MGGSLIINALFYMHSGISPGTTSIGFKTKISYSPKILLVVYYFTMYGFTHLVVNQKTNQYMVYTPLGGSPTINVMVCAHFEGLPRLKV